MHIVCPHCHNPIEVVRIVPREEIACPSCGSSFHLEMGSTTVGGNIAGQKLGKFEVIDTVGQGGFGTVYKARDPELDRVVAVKVPRAGNVAGPQELDRFLREARSAAQLRHPSIVSVHEVGQADGLPYIVSDFVRGVTLTDLLSARRPAFRESAELIAAAADALQYAHEHGVIHRDVKPSNIMIGEDGRPFVMDFGLAKREAGEITMTVEGQVLGTPAYMAPEQARGEGHKVDGRADVYSLGVVLYQLLTGELPFRGTQRMLLLQVLQDEPRPPRRLNDRIPRDLETVCLKAMAKEPGRRYGTARELADELRRWLKGEAIKARPEGRWERAVRWARRKPAVAALLALFVVTLLSGTAVSTYFALDARRREQDTKDALGKVTEREKQVSEANTRLNDETAELEETLAVSLLRPLGQDTIYSLRITDPEIDALWELARTDNERVRLLFIENALQQRVTARQLRNRADMAVHAAVELDPARRRRVEEALLVRLRDPESDFSIRTACVFTGLALEDGDLDFASAAARQVVEAMGKETDGNAPGPFLDLQQLADAVKSLAPRLGPAEASADARRTLEAMGKTTRPVALHCLSLALAALAPRMGPGEASADARQAVMQILEVLETKYNGIDSPYPLVAALAALAPRLERAEASVAARLALEKMGKETDAFALFALAEVVASLAARLDPEEASADAGQAARQVLDALGKRYSSYLAQALAALAPRLAPEEASIAARQALEALGKTTGPNDKLYLAQAVGALAARLDSEEASADARQAARQVLDAVGKRNNSYSLADLAQAVAALAPWLNSGEKSAAARQVREAMEKEAALGQLNQGWPGLRELAPWLEPAEASADARQILEAMEKTNNPYYGARCAEALIVKVEPEDASRRNRALAAAIGNLGAPSALFAGLAPLAEASRPLPGRLTEQQLVDLLKMPTCQQPARQIIVRQLGWQCGQTFADLWEFVDWAREHRPDLDLTSPPVRPANP